MVDGNAMDKEKANEEKLRQQEEFKHTILTQILNQEARARCTYFDSILFRLEWLRIFPNTDRGA